MMEAILIPTKAFFKHYSFHCPVVFPFHNFLDIIWPHQGHFPVFPGIFYAITDNGYIFGILKTTCQEALNAVLKYGLILKTSLISSGSHFRHVSSQFALQFTIQSKRRKNKFERTSRDLWLKKYNDVTHSSIVLVRTHSSSVGFSLMTRLQLNGSAQRQQAELLLQLLAHPAITTYLMLRWGLEPSVYRHEMFWKLNRLIQ